MPFASCGSQPGSETIRRGKDGIHQMSGRRKELVRQASRRTTQVMIGHADVGWHLASLVLGRGVAQSTWDAMDSSEWLMVPNE